jgi:hypothetical protein
MIDEVTHTNPAIPADIPCKNQMNRTADIIAIAK